MSDRPPKFNFVPVYQTYGDLNTSWSDWDKTKKAWLISASVTREGLLHEESPIVSWEAGVTRVNSTGATAAIVRDRQRPLLLMGLNTQKTAYAVVYDPHDLAGKIEPTALLNFRRVSK